MKTRVIFYMFLGLLLASSTLFEVTWGNIIIENSTDNGLSLVINKTWTQEIPEIEHILLVYDYSSSTRANTSASNWREELTQLNNPDGWRIIGVLTEIEHHEPYGVLETRIDVLMMLENNTEYDWYDVTVTQTLTPGANNLSDWGWSKITYTMDGTHMESNIMLSDYDPPPSHEAPRGVFTFLWQLLGFDLRQYLPWFGVQEPRLESYDMSDFGSKTYRVQYSASREYSGRYEPLEIRHHYVVKVSDGSMPVFWHQTQIEYTQRDDYAQIPYLTPPMASGYIKVNPGSH